MNEKGLFSSQSDDTVIHITNEIHFQLYNLQIYYVKFLSIIAKPFFQTDKDIIDLIKSYLGYSLNIYDYSTVDFNQILQVQSHLLRIINPYINENDQIRFSRLITAGLILYKLSPYISHESKIISDILCALYHGYSLESINLSELQDAIIAEPHLSKLLISLININLSETNIYSICSLNAIDIYLKNPDKMLNILLIIGQCLSFNESDKNCIKKLLSISKSKNCILKHVTIEIGLKQSANERYTMSQYLKTIITDDLLMSLDSTCGFVSHVDEKLCYILIVNGSLSSPINKRKLYELGWLVLVSNPKGFVNILLTLINTLIKAQCVDQLCILLKSKCMRYFNQLLLVNLWHPELANVSIMEVLLNTCYPTKSSDSSLNYIEQLCLKIRTRWDTLTTFNSRLSNIKDYSSHNHDIVALTTMSNTSHLELISGLIDPTGVDENSILGLLERSGRVYDNSILNDKSIHFETEILEECCDKSIYYCAVSIRKVWECLIMSSQIDTRQTIINFLYPNNTLELINPEYSFYVTFRAALLNNDLILAEEIYQKSIISRLEYLKRRFGLINPLSLRLELLENIYSLLFVTEYDLFTPYLNNQTHSKNLWPMPETFITNSSRLRSNSDTMEKFPNLNKDKFVCSFFLCKDLLVCLEYHLQEINLEIDSINNQNSNLQNIDYKMANYINYPSCIDIQDRINTLSNLLEDLHWRIDLFSTNKLDFNYDSIGIINIPINVIFDSNSRQLSDIFRPRINQKFRSKSHTLIRKPQVKTQKRKSITVDVTKLRGQMDKMTLIPKEKAKQRNITRDIYYDTQVLNLKSRESSEISSNDDTLLNSNELIKLPKLNHPKMNVQFLMESISWIIEPMEYLAITALVCGFKDKASNIAKKYNSVKINNPLLVDLLTEIRYQISFDKFVEQLGQISTPIIEEKSLETSNKSFGHYDWNKLSNLSAKLSSNKENQIVEIVNHLLMLNGTDRPIFKSSNTINDQCEPTNKNYINNKIKDFNSGLLLDLTLYGSTTKWQILQMIGEIESRQSTDIATNDNKIVLESTGYHRLPGLRYFVKQLHNSLDLDIYQDKGTYTSIEMKGAMKIKYYTMMKKWLSKLHIIIKVLQFNMTDSVEFENLNPDTETRWSNLIKLTDFLKSSLCTPNESMIPYEYLIRNVPAYLESLQSHLEVFAKFLNDQKQFGEQNLNSFVSSTQPYLLHEFSILKRSPSEVLGELIFLQFADPLCSEIRQISQDLGLDISEVILNNCLPLVCCSADEMKLEMEPAAATHQCPVYNQPEGILLKKTYNLDPTEIVTGCLETVVKLILKNSCKIVTDESSQLNSDQIVSDISSNSSNVRMTRKSSSNSFETTSNSSGINNKDSSIVSSKSEKTNVSVIHCDWKTLSELCEEEEWLNMLMIDIIDLNNIDIDLLETNSERSAFFINLYNLMMIHIMVLAIQMRRSTMKFRSFNSRLLRESFCYNIGKIGVINVYQISQYYLNIPDITFCDLDENNEEIVPPMPLETEQRYRNTCPIIKALSIFGLIDGTISGPSLKVYKNDNLIGDLQNNLSYIIKFQSSCDTDKRQIFLPQIFKWYNMHIPFNIKSNTYPKPNDNNIVERILSNCNEEISRKYSQLLHVETESISYNKDDPSYPKFIKIMWLSRSEDIGCTIIERVENIRVRTPRISDFKSPTITSMNHLSISNLNETNNIPTPKYHPTTTSIDHIRYLNPLLACIVYSIIGDDFIPAPINNDLKLDPKRLASEYIDEIHSYKYSRMQSTYAPIGNWMTRYWIPWYNNTKIPQTLQLNLSSYPEILLSFCKDNIPIEIRWAAFSHPKAKNLDKVLLDYSIQFMNRNPKRYFLIASAIRNLHSKTFNNNYELQRLVDILLVKSAHHWATDIVERTQINKHLPPDNSTMHDESIKYQENRLLDCIYAIKDNNLRLSESYRYLELLNIDNVVTLMETNLSLLSHKNEKIEKLLKTLRIYKRISDLVSYCLTQKDELLFKAHLPTEYLNWQYLQNASENNPDQVFKFLIQQKKFDLCQKWVQIFMKNDGKERTEAEYIVSLVNDDNDKENIVELISHVSKLYIDRGVDKLLKVVHHVIAHSEVPLPIIICCAFIIKEDILSKIKDSISSLTWQNIVVRAWVGASMLRTIPNGIIRDQYSHLVTHPDLIMEQLIMNSQIGLFKKMVDLCKEQRKAYIAIKRGQSCGYLSKCNTDEFIEELEPYMINKLLTEYTLKALELPASRVDEDIDNDYVSNLTKLSTRRNSVISLNCSRIDLLSSNESTDTVIHKKRGSNDNFNLRPDIHNVPSNTSLPEDKWISDKDAPICMCCKKEVFSMFNRRHHCRKCGFVICGLCSIHRSSIDGVTVRICNDCFKAIQDNHDANKRARHGSFIMDDNRYRSTREMLYSRHNMQSQNESPISTSSVPLTTLDLPDPSLNSPIEDSVGALENGWRLGVDLNRNGVVRQIFYYDDAPSITLAFSLTHFHSNSNDCGNALLDRVEYLADFLKPMKNGLPNPEVDYLLVIDIAKRITYKAKEKFSFTNNDLDFARAEVYLSRLDLLGILVRSNYSHCLPSLSDGSKFREKIESLRDKLIREERLELAGIVSSKAGLTNDPVFVAMGLHALEEGKYDEARRLFASCSKSGRLGSFVGTSLSYPLNEIMKILEKNELSVEKIGEMLDILRDNDDLLKCPELKYMKDFDISQKQIEEAIYYFDTFNAPLHCLQFLCRQQMWSKATDYVIRKNVSKDIFIDGIVGPAVSAGRFSAVKSEMLMRDGGITCWRNYYEVLCTYLGKKKCYVDLLELQEYNRDHLRTAGTLIKHFYLSSAQSYDDLDKNLPHLLKAQLHFEKLIRNNQSNINNETERYQKNLVLIKQQIEATKFVTNQITLSHYHSGYGYNRRSNPPPTLFSPPDAIVDFCLMILFCRPNMLDGLQMLCPMMPLCHIYPEKILPKAVTWLLQNSNLVIQTKTNNSECNGIDSVLELCGYVNNCYRLDSRKNDDVLIAMLPAIPNSLLQPQIINKFIKLLKSEQKKIEAHILMKDFKRAYTSAIKLKYVDDVKRILELAQKMNDTSGAIDLCNHWLKSNNTDV